MTNYRQERNKQEENDKKWFRWACMVLGSSGIVQIRADYDGYGDSGDFDSIVFLDKDDNPIDCPEDVDEHRIKDVMFYYLPGGFEGNEGSFGTLVVDIPTASICAEHKWRYIETEEELFTYDL